MDLISHWELFCSKYKLATVLPNDINDVSAKFKDFGEPALAAFQGDSNPGVDVVFLVDDHTFRSYSGFGNREGKLLVQLAALGTAALQQPSQVSLCESIKCPSGQRRQLPCQCADGRS